jgi:hypothetical protein
LTKMWACSDANYHAGLGAAVLEARSTSHSIDRYNTQLGAMYVDDFNQFGPWRVAQLTQDEHRIDSEKLAGKDVINVRKNVCAPSTVVVGCLFCNATRTVSLCATMYLKLLCLFFHELPLSLQATESISVKLLQRVGSYMSNTALTVVSMKPFTRAVHNNYSRAGRRTHVQLSVLSMSDIQMWRALLIMSFSDTRWLRVSWYISPYVACPHNSDRAAWALRMASQAAFVGHSDAMRNKARHGIGAVFAMGHTPSSPFAWFMDVIPRDLTYVTVERKAVPFDINLLEAIALIIGFIALVQHIQTLPRPQYAADCEQPFVHIHLWCDNTSAMWWLISNRTRSAFHAALFQLFIQVQLLSGVVVTLGHVAGVDNPIADAVSRAFDVENGPLYRQQLEAPAVSQWQVSFEWLTSMAQQCSAMSRTTLKLVPVALTIAAKLCSPPSV